MAELLIGCGNSRKRWFKGLDGREDWADLVTLDEDPNCHPDHNWCLEEIPFPFFHDDQFDHIEAIHVLEHVGRQGDYRFFFTQFAEFWRILRPGGQLCGIVPAPGSPWVFGDPGHTRFFMPEWLTFLDQSEYTTQIGKTAMTDYRHVYQADFSAIGEIRGERAPEREFWFRLTAIKPSRISL